ncbi:unnamed protein product [Euphydryas editha]|uniref:Reverse transcriptase domain-containing protein n=1 Tax=Euphydryas editha TaxID=104508 RepID=A0AAU9TQ05_EUPED|nr:unnamed protein product [Euphydryas editha]
MCNVINHCKSYQFADDSAIISTAKDPLETLNKLQSDFDNLNKRCHDSDLVLNATKTKLLDKGSPYAQNKQVSKNLIAHDHSCLHLHNGTNHLSYNNSTTIETESIQSPAFLLRNIYSPLQ